MVIILCAQQFEAAPATADASALSALRALPQVRVRAYSVYGETLQEISRSLDLNGPRDERNISRDAVTKWDVTWNWSNSKLHVGSDAPDKEIKTMPRLAHATVRAWVQVVVPRLQGLYSKSVEMRRAWRRYNRALLRHESRHVENVLGNADLMLREFQARSSRNPAATLQEAQEIAKRSIARIRAFDRDYDRTTRHGRRQGVRLRSIPNSSIPNNRGERI